MPDLLPWLVIVLLILLNGVFVAAEFAIIGAPRAAIERRAVAGDRVAGIVAATLADPRRQDRYIATAQLGITFASLGLGMYGEHVLAEAIVHWFEGLGAAQWLGAHAVASVISVAILTYFHIVIGEMVPKSLALQRAESTVLGVTPLMTATRFLLYPLVVGLNELGNAILRLFGVRRVIGAEGHYSPEELKYLVEESVEGGLLGPDAGVLLGEVFDFGELTAGEVMVPRVRVIGLPLGASPDTLSATLRRDLHTRYPVYEQNLDQIAGVIHVKEAVGLLAANVDLTPEHLHAPPFVPETATLETVLAAMRRTRVQLAIVLDEFGGTAGIVTLEDLFEEVVGEIDEEPGPPDIQPDGDVLQVSGAIRLDEASERLGHVLDHEDVDTVGGLVLTLLNRPAEVGDIVRYDGVVIEVVAVNSRAVSRVAIRRLET